MWRKSRQLALLFLSAIFWLCDTPIVNAQKQPVPADQVRRVISVLEDTSGNFVLLNTANRSTLPRPFIQYLPAAGGQAQMVVDFPGTKFDGQPCSINLPLSPIKQVHIGQLQISPPIMRVTFLGKGTEQFQGIEFRARPGSLIVKLPQPLEVQAPGPKNQTTSLAPPNAPAISPPKAPDIILAQERATPPQPAPPLTKGPLPAQLRGPIAYPAALPLTSGEQDPGRGQPATILPPVGPRKPPLAPSTPLLSSDKVPKTQEAGIAAPSKTSSLANLPAVLDSPAGKGKTKSAGEAGRQADTPPAADRAQTALSPQSTPLSVEIASLDPLAVRIHSTAPSSFHCFRLRDPERYVIDIEGISNQQDIVLPQPETNPWLSEMRIGSPEGSPNTTRLVLDLLRPDVSVLPCADNKNNSLVLTLKRQLPTMQEIRPPEGAIVVLDAGHGGSDPGAQRGDIQEKEITLSIVAKLKKELEKRGIRIILTRFDDTFVSLEDRVKITNETAPDAFVSVHINSLETNNVIQGIETYYQNDRSKDLAQLIHESLVNKLTVPDRLVRKARFYVINHTNHPAILAEVGFISNKEERDKLISSDYQEQVAEALANGVILYLASKSDTIGLKRGENKAAPSIAETLTENLQSVSPGQTKTKPLESAASAIAPDPAKGNLKHKVNMPRLRSKEKHLAARRS